jgi:uncharacterized protein YndB with AHSA1/START domain
MVTVTYEQARGLREKHQMPDGYQIGASKTIVVPIVTLFEAWQNLEMRACWLPDAPLSIRKATPNKSLRIDWENGRSRIDVGFYAKGDNKSQVSLQHSKLPDAERAAQMKAYWTAALARLKKILEA